MRTMMLRRGDVLATPGAEAAWFDGTNPSGSAMIVVLVAAPPQHGASPSTWGDAIGGCYISAQGAGHSMVRWSTLRRMLEEARYSVIQPGHGPAVEIRLNDGESLSDSPTRAGREGFTPVMRAQADVDVDDDDYDDDYDDD